MIATEFNLNDTIRTVIDDGVGPDPRDIAAKVLELIPMGMERELLAALLPERCRQVLIKPRYSRRVGQTNNGNASEKWAEVRRSILVEAYEVEGTWKLLGDMSREEVEWVAEDRLTRGIELSAEGTRLSNLAALMKKRKVSAVRELPIIEIEKVMS